MKYLGKIFQFFLAITILLATQFEQTAEAGLPNATVSARNLGVIAPELTFFTCDPNSGCRGLNPGIDGSPRQEDPCIITQCANIQAIKQAGNWELLRHRLIQVCKEVGAPVKIFSGYRNPAHNTCVAGKKRSRHMQADAVDFFVDAPSERVRRAMCKLPGGKGGPYKDGSYHLDLARTRVWTKGMVSTCSRVSVVKTPDRKYVEKRNDVQKRMRDQQMMGIPTTLAFAGEDWFKKQPPLTYRYETRNTDVAPRETGRSFFSLVGDYYINGIRRIDDKPQFAPSPHRFVRFFQMIEAMFTAHAAPAATEEDAFKKEIKNPRAPRLCRAAQTMQSGYCDQNYDFAHAALECLYRVNEAELIGGLAVEDRVVQNGERKQEKNFRDSSYDYKVAEAVSLRFRGILKRAIQDVSSYSSRLTTPIDDEGSDPTQAACWQTAQNDIAKVLYELRNRLMETDVNARATSFLKKDTKIRLTTLEGNDIPAVTTAAVAETDSNATGHGRSPANASGGSPTHDHGHDHADPHFSEMESEIDAEFRESMGL